MNGVEYFSAALGTIVLALLFFVLNKRALRVKAGDLGKGFVVRIPSAIKWISLACALFWCALMIVMTIFKNESVTAAIYILFALFALLGLVIFGFALQFHIVVSEDQLCVKMPFLNEKIIKFSQITKCKTTSQGIAVYVGKKNVVEIARFYVNYGLFVKHITQAGIEFGGDHHQTRL